MSSLGSSPCIPPRTISVPFFSRSRPGLRYSPDLALESPFHTLSALLSTRPPPEKLGGPPQRLFRRCPMADRNRPTDWLPQGTWQILAISRCWFESVVVGLLPPTTSSLKLVKNALSNLFFLQRLSVPVGFSVPLDGCGDSCLSRSIQRPPFFQPFNVRDAATFSPQDKFFFTSGQVFPFLSKFDRLF